MPVRVRTCELTGLLSAIVYLNLVDLDESQSRAALLAEAGGGRNKPSRGPAFPGRSTPPASPTDHQSGRFLLSRELDPTPLE